MREEIDWFSRGFAQAGRVRTRYVLREGASVFRGEELGALLASWIFARSQAGSFVVRVYDVGGGASGARTWEELQSLARELSLTWDEGPDVGGPYGPYRSSRRLEVYRHFAERLLRLGKARAYLVTSGPFPEALHPISAERVLDVPGERKEEVWIVYPWEGAGFPSGGPFLSLPEGGTGVVLVGERGGPSLPFAEVVDDALMDITAAFPPRPQKKEELAVREALFESLGFSSPEWRAFPPTPAWEEFRTALKSKGVVISSSSEPPLREFLRVWLRLAGAEEGLASAQDAFEVVFPRISLSSEGAQRPV
ncbi:glutamate--tRNA ligase family protein [Brockia lithotrophica]|uniref:tRNA synthetase class I (E and Q) n=1 Tax=Brockia lithotrophica TaxID=933949 RepID=A0A660KW64_9BACL|nr:glutamate--tRNA ligase family protein [Brockia lithotrophica]RKQ85591.1 tRNA synthetase class I (E and Q) [Brockia lithotrophica]